MGRKVDMEFTRSLVDAVALLDRARRAAGFKELHLTFIDHDDPEDAEYDGWTATGRDVLGRFHYASEAQGPIGVSV